MAIIRIYRASVNNQYELEDCEYYGWSRENMTLEIGKEAKQLFLEIQEWLLTSSNTDLSRFEPKTKKIDMIPYNVQNNVTTEEK